MTDASPEAPRLNRTFQLPIILSFLLLGVAGASAIVGTFSAGYADRALTHSLEVRQAEAVVYIEVQAAETGQRGYLLTGDLGYLQPFTQAQQQLPTIQGQLRTLVRNDPVQSARLDMVDALVGRKMRELGETITLREAGKTDQALALVKTDLGQDLMKQVANVLTQFDAVERQRLAVRQANARLLNAAVSIIVPASVALAALIAALVVRAARIYEAELDTRNRSLRAEIAQREATEAQLRQAQKMEALGQLTGGVAHDFNNMLAIIIGNLDLLSRRLAPEDGRLRTLVENGVAAAQRAAALTRRLLAFSRLQPLNPKPTDINKCVGGMSEMLRRTLGEGVVIETVLGGGVWPARVDQAQLESAILNLAVNARDAMPGGGRLTLETANASLDQAYADKNAEVTPGQYVLIAVTDTGVGMSEQVLAKAFDPFFTTKGVGDGTGLGLSQVHGFVKQSNGHIKIYSEPGVGTSVKIYLPRDVSGRSAEAESPAARTTPIDQRVTILVVEDDPGVRQTTVSTVRELGYRVIEADSAMAALERLAENPDVDLMLTDVVMPGMNGRKLIDAALERRPDLKVLFMTGYTRNAIVHNGVLDPGTRLITKPFTIEELDRELRLTLGERL